jgi:hypothetical protein
VKPSGYLMVEGVAQSVNHFLDILDESENEKDQSVAPNNVISPPSRLNALRWLWEAPGNARKS